MNRNTSISLGSYFDEFVKNRIANGRFNNASEVIRAGLRLLEEEENKIIALKNAIQEGIDSGIATEFDPEKHLAQLKADRNKMPKYRLSNKAVEDLSEIWSYTLDKWSEKQADSYYYMLLDNCREIAENPIIGKNYFGISEQLFGFKAGSHIIFYQSLDDNLLEIVRILHEKMDLKNQLNK